MNSYFFIEEVLLKMLSVLMKTSSYVIIFEAVSLYYFFCIPWNFVLFAKDVISETEKFI